MRRFLKASALFTAGLVLFLSGCAGDSITSPSGTPGTTGGTCTVTITLVPTTSTPLAGTAITVRATILKNGVAIPDGSSVAFVTDLGFFNENGLPTVFKTVLNGVADVTPGSFSAGTAHIKATFECAQATIPIDFQPVQGTGPFISTISPTTGSCAGGDSITIDGGLFGNNIGTTRVTFGGAPGSLVSVSNTEIKVKTPARTLANPQVPELVDVIVTIGSGTAGAVTIPKLKAFTYVCIDPNKRISISSINPIAGSPNGGDAVDVFGVNFGTNVATTRVTFCGVAAQITTQQDNDIKVLTPRHILNNPSIPEVCDVAVTTDLGLVSQQAAVLPNAFTYRGAGGTGGCNTDPGFFTASLSPNTGTPSGGTIVTINGGGFGTNPLNLRVDFGGSPAAITTVSATVITVSTPIRNLANPSVPETVDVTVTDISSPTLRCAKLVNAFRYTSVALDPSIFDVAPRTGPNDARTRVTIFGNNFQFPAHVFFGTAAFGQVEATVVGSIALDQIVVLAPAATGANAIIANKTVDVTVLNSTSGKQAVCTLCYRYYGCPSVAGASPNTAPYSQQTTVTINGANFEEPLEAVFATGSNTFRLNVTSVSSSAVVVTMPPLATILQGNPASISCVNVAGNITLTFQSLACNPVSAAFTYRVDPPSMTSAGPRDLNQDGSSFGSPLGSPQAIITALGANFTDPISVSLIKNGVTVSNTTTIAVVSNQNTLTFTAPAVTNAAMETNNCVIGTGVTGVQFVPTQFGIRITNTRTGCVADLPAYLTYHPANGACVAGLSITTASLPTGIICTPYSASVSAGGGTPPYTFNFVSGTLPPGLSFNAAGVLSGTPILASGGPGQASQLFNFTLGVTDSASATTSRSFSMAVTDPDAPLTISGNPFQSVGSGGGTGSTLTATPNPTPAGYTPVSWSILSIAPSPAPGSITLSSATGQTNALVVTGTVPANNYLVTVQILDTICSGPQHSATLGITMSK